MNKQQHKERMKQRRADYQSRANMVPPSNVMANLGRSHPDYGVHPHTHADRKAGKVGAQ